MHDWDYGADQAMLYLLHSVWIDIWVSTQHSELYIEEESGI
jgi:hypothetical protein